MFVVCLKCTIKAYFLIFLQFSYFLIKWSIFLVFYTFFIIFTIFLVFYSKFINFYDFFMIFWWFFDVFWEVQKNSIFRSFFESFFDSFFGSNFGIFFGSVFWTDFGPFFDPFFDQFFGRFFEGGEDPPKKGVAKIRAKSSTNSRFGLFLAPFLPSGDLLATFWGSRGGPGTGRNRGVKFWLNFSIFWRFFVFFSWFLIIFC